MMILFFILSAEAEQKFYLLNSFDDALPLVHQIRKSYEGSPVIIFFDVDQTLLDSSVNIHTGVARDARQSIRKQYISVDKESDIPESIQIALQEESFALKEAEQRELAPPIVAPGAAECIQQIRAMGIKTFVCTDYPTDCIENRIRILKESGFVFDNCAIDHDAFVQSVAQSFVEKKDNPEAFKELLMKKYTRLLPKFNDGVLCATKLIDKGLTIRAFLEQTAPSDATIILVDDKPENFLRTERSINNDFYGFFYTHFLTKEFIRRGLTDLGLSENELPADAPELDDETERYLGRETWMNRIFPSFPLTLRADPAGPLYSPEQREFVKKTAQNLEERLQELNKIEGMPADAKEILESVFRDMKQVKAFLEELRSQSTSPSSSSPSLVWPNLD